MLEALQHDSNSFVTLTYSDANLPHTSSSSDHSSLATLQRADFTAWLKRYRKALEPKKIRYYAVGEYGDDSWRPHYHAAIFNGALCDRLRTLRNGKNRPDPDRCCPTCRLVHSTWGKGLVDVGTVEAKSAAYLAGYVEKKLTRSDDVRLLGREREFSAMSLRPGIAHSAMWQLASDLMIHDLEKSEADVPSALLQGKNKHLPLGRYLVKNLRQMVGKDGALPESKLREIQEKLLPLRLAAKTDAENCSLSRQVLAQNKQARASMKARRKIFNMKKGSL
jgi:hypothetical protein